MFELPPASGGISPVESRELSNSSSAINTHKHLSDNCHIKICGSLYISVRIVIIIAWIIMSSLDVLNYQYAHQFSQSV